MKDQYYISILCSMFDVFSEEEASALLSKCSIKDLEAGQYLIQQGDIENHMYIVLNGMFRTVVESEQGTQVLGDVSVGEPVGELAIFTKAPRSASVIALRHSTVLTLDEADYIHLSKKYPTFSISLTRYIILRLTQNAKQGKAGGAPKNIAVIQLHPEDDLQIFMKLFQQEFVKMNAAIHIYDAESLKNTNKKVLFDKMDTHNGLNFLMCDSENLEWTNLCLVYCDLVILTSYFGQKSDIISLEQTLKLHEKNVLNKKNYLLLLHDENGPEPEHTNRWYEGRELALHLHIRKNNEKDARRFGRIILHKGIGLVLGGGGAKGIAHAGATEALVEDGLEFDFIGGTSAGALLAVGIAHSDFNFTKLAKYCESGALHKVTTNDYTFPMLSLMSGRKIRRYLNDILQEKLLEDLWINTFCITTNFSTSQMNIIEKGLAKKCIEASTAIPGLLPPVIFDQQLHIDGGLLDNLPIEPMFQKPVKHVVAISLSEQENIVINETTTPSVRKLIWSKYFKKTKTTMPGIPTLLINSLTISSNQKQKNKKGQASTYLVLQLKGFGFLDWSKWRSLIKTGYKQTKDYLSTLPKEDKFW
ncbi:MAG: cyclic nucleotide-binding and patatin-like phospholipase domain-containing protein [Saprospiraceae bacterium]